jgi:phage protein D
MADLMTATAKYTLLENKYGNFMVPAFKIKANGMDIISKNDLTVPEIVITLSLESAGMAVIKVADCYNVEKHSFDKKIKGLFKLGTVMEIEIGYLSDTTAVFKGYVAGFGAEFGDTPILVVKLMDARKLMMTGGVRNQLYEDKNYSDIFKKVMGRYSKLCSVVADATSDKLTSPVSQNTSDYNFVRNELLKKGKSEREFFVLYDKAYFRKPYKNKTPIMSVTFGRELLRLSTMADYLDTEIQVIGFDPVKSQSISSKQKAKSPESQTSVLSPAQQQFFIDPDADSEEKAKIRAASIADKMKMKSCFAEGELIGLPEIVPGRFLKVEDVDDTVDKSYYLDEVVHYVTETSFRTTFEARGWV